MLDSAWVDRIHARLLVRYGAAWIAKYQGIPDALVKADWAEELAGIRGEAIRHALEHLPPDFPPSVMQFRDLCLRAPEAPMARLPAPKADPERVAAELKRMADMRRGAKPLQWAYALQEREQQGHHLTAAQRASWRLALQGHSDESIGGVFAPIDPAALPPGMRADANTVVVEEQVA
jgi:hypothetical protein